MLRNASGINGYSIFASDGHVGNIRDFLFDDVCWVVRWLVVDTGRWHANHRVLLPPSVLGHPNRAKREFAVRLTIQEIKNSPAIDTDEPISQQIESNIYDYYRLVPYWGVGHYLRRYGFSGGLELPGLVRPREAKIPEIGPHSGDPHLRSIESVTGYHVHALDGDIGHVEDFRLEDADWSVHYFVVDSRNWWPEKKVLVSLRSAQSIDWKARQIDLDVDRRAVEDGPSYNETMIVDRNYEKHFHSYYDGIGPSGPP